MDHLSDWWLCIQHFINKSCTEFLFLTVVALENYIVVFPPFYSLVGLKTAVSSIINVGRKLYKNSKHMGKNISKMAAAGVFCRRALLLVICLNHMPDLHHIVCGLFNLRSRICTLCDWKIRRSGLSCSAK